MKEYTAKEMKLLKANPYTFKVTKLHYAAYGHTAAEVIYQRADAEKPFMGLTSFLGELHWSLQS